MENIDLQALLSAFKVLGGDKNGRMDYGRISSLLVNKMGLSKNAVKELLESKNHRKGKELDFLSLCVSIISTKETFERVLSENDRPLTGNKKVNSRTFTRRKGSGRSSSSASGGRKSENSDSVSIHTESLKGCIFNTDSAVGLCGNRFLLELTENSGVEIIAQAINNQGLCYPSPAIEVLMFIENEEPNKKLVTFSSFLNAEGYCTIKMNLKKGKYLLVPVTLDWSGEAIGPDLEVMEELTDMEDDEGEITLTQKCKTALKTIFDCIDLDRNGMLSEIEFDLFIQHICGETAADEWSTVEDNFDTMNGQLTFDGFLSLYKMALVTDFKDVTAMFRKMGLNNALTMEKGLPFLLTVAAKITKPILKPLTVSTFDSLMEEVFRKTAMEQGQCAKIQNMNDLFLYTHELSHRVTNVVKNQSHSKLKVQLDCQNSENCVSHRKSLDFVVEVNPKTSMIGHHLFPASHGEPWSVQCVQTVVQ